MAEERALGEPEVRRGEATAAPSRWVGHFSITVTLATAISLFVLVAAGSVLGVGVWLAQKNTFALLSKQAHQVVSATTDRVELHLRAAEHQTRFLAARIAEDAVDPDDSQAFGNMLIGALAAAPQIEAVMYIDGAMQGHLAAQDEKTGTVVLRRIDYSRDEAVRARMAHVGSVAHWGAPIWREQYKKTYLNLAYPVRRNGELQGGIVAVVSIRELSNFVAEADLESAGRHFILHGRDRILAHSLLINEFPGLSSEQPLPLLASFGDPVLSSIWQREARYDLSLSLPEGTRGQVLDTLGDRYVFVYQRVAGFGAAPLIVGVYFRDAEVGEEIRRMKASLAVGIFALLISLLGAIILGRRIARPIVTYSRAATRIRDLDISKVDDLPGSIFRELNDQSIAFNAMLRALRWFELYVPKKVVEILVKQGSVGGTISDARHITVMFTDIVGFSALSEGMAAAEIAALVNHHFTLVADCIEREGGTVDKFIGDSVMAFWGAPEQQDDSATRACRAALAIGAALRDDNLLRQARGEAPIHIRIGIHTGTVTVANIGSPNRLNYTIIGDTANIGQRLEQLGREVYPPGTEVATLISAEVACELDGTFALLAAGRHKLKGRTLETEVFKLELGDQGNGS